MAARQLQGPARKPGTGRDGKDPTLKYAKKAGKPGQEELC